MSEVRITDRLTGGEKGSKPERYDLIPPAAMDEVARVYGMGATKYAERNWEKGYDWGLSLAALHRHVKAFERREDFDSESGLHHLAHAVFHCLALMTYQANGLGTDTRSGVCKAVCKPSETPPKPQGPMQHGPALLEAARRLLVDPVPNTKRVYNAWVEYIDRAREIEDKAWRDKRNRELYLDGCGKAVSVLDPRRSPYWGGAPAYGIDMCPEPEPEA